jgi:multiple sugar transport system substrate-binding protein
MKASVLNLVLASAAAVATLSCSSESRQPRSPAASEKPAAPQRILRLLAEDSPQLTAFARIATQYQATTGIGIEIDRRGNIASAGDDGAKHAGYDLLIAPHRTIGQLVDRGDVQRIDDFLADPALYNPQLLDPHKDLFAGWWPELSWYRGHAYGYPFALHPASLWYREDLFDDEDEASAFEKRFGRPLSFPRTPSELEQVVEFFHRPQQSVYGTVLHGRADASLVHEWLEYAAMFNARILESASGDTYGDIVVNSPEAVRATEFFAGLVRYAPPDAMKYTQTDAVRAFERRRIALGIMRHDLAQSGSSDRNAPAGGGVGYAPVPSVAGRSVNVIDGETFLIPRGTVQAREAFALMQWTASHDTQVALILNGGLSVRATSFDDPRVSALPKARQSAPFMPIWTFPGLVRAKELIPTPTIAESDQIAEAMSSALAQILTGVVTPKIGLDDIARRLSEILKGRAKLRYAPRAYDRAFGKRNFTGASRAGLPRAGTPGGRACGRQKAKPGARTEQADRLAAIHSAGMSHVHAHQPRIYKDAAPGGEENRKPLR